MDLTQPRGISARLQQRLLVMGLDATGTDARADTLQPTL
jgi:hypothetical protein